MDILQILSIFTLVTGAAYLILQILQSKWMWYVYIPSCAAGAAVYFINSTWAFFAVNVYFVIMGFIGIYNWRRDEKKLKASGAEITKDNVIHINKLTRKELIASLLIIAAGIPVIYFVLCRLDAAMLASGAQSSAPMPELRHLVDAISAIMSIVATWWLTRSHLEQWYMWLVADIFVVVLNILLGNWWMVALYCFYICSIFFGIWNWRKNGVVVDQA